MMKTTTNKETLKIQEYDGGLAGHGLIAFRVSMQTNSLLCLIN